MTAVGQPPPSLDRASGLRQVAPTKSSIKKRQPHNYLVLRSRRISKPSYSKEQEVSMATISLPRPVPAHRSSSPSRDDALNLDATNSTTTRPIPIPNKHIPDCPTGPRPDRGPTPPPSPPQHCRADLQPHSLLYPPTQYAQIPHMDIPVYHITPAGVAAALRHIATIPLPDPSKVFPWFHGLHPQNRVQESFFFQRKKGFKRYPTPDCFRAITLVKANGDLSTQLLKGAIRADEFLHKFKEKDASGTLRNCFKDIDPKDGFSVRNFQIQAAKVAMLSDIVVYGSDEVECKRLARDIAEAQTLWLDAPGRSKGGKKIPFYNTFVCTAPFSHFEEGHADVVVVDSNGELTGAVTDFFHQERLEMAIMTKASEIATNVWLGPTPDASLGSNGGEYDLLIECSDHGQLNAEALKDLVMKFDDYQHPKCIEFPSSGSIMPPTWTPGEAEDIVESCRWIYNLAQGIRPVSHAGWAERGANETSTFSATPRKILIHCADGYTESTMFAIAYYIFAHGVPVSKAWLELHTEKKRNFFAYPSDVALLNAISPALLSASPTKPHSTEGITRVIQCEPEWLQKMDGSLPSRITDYMYLGNLGHANNPELLRELGIGQVLSIGEVRNWIPEDEGMGAWEGRVLLVQRVQDNGVDELTEDMERCLAFIDKGRKEGTATLVHCRVGVSRSATICIAEVMRDQQLSYPRAYSYVRARRLNVIIQPHLRFSYELLKWEETLQQRRGEGVKREMEWGDIARCVAEMNRPYAS